MIFASYYITLTTTFAVSFSTASTSCSKAFSEWRPTWMPLRDELRCKPNCDADVKTSHFSGNWTSYDKCCVCHSCASWEGNEIDLVIEYVSVMGKSLVIVEKPFEKVSVYKIELQYGEMSEFPSNICNWDDDVRIGTLFGSVSIVSSFIDFQENVVTIDLTGNKIRKIPDINCLIRLDTLKLAGNKIGLLSNTSIANLTYLRHVDLTNNILKAIDPNTLVNQNLNILVGLFAGNEITTGDVSNWLKERPFCEYDFSNNKISQLTNTKNITLNPDKIYGTGFLILAGNLITTFPDLKTLLNLDSLNMFGTLINFGFDLRNVPLTCDCHMQPYHHLASSTLVQLWRDYFNLTCASPESLKDASIYSVDPHDFVCELTQADKCPRGCKCIDQPQNDTIYIDCESANLLEMPTELPTSTFSNKISLNLAQNDITTLANVSYLHKLSLINLSRNDLGDVGNNIFGKLENAVIDISINPRIRVLPRLIQYRNVCETVLSKLIVDCNCDTLWIESWLKTRSCDNMDQSNYFKCHVPGKGTIYGTEFSESLLDCQHDLTHLISTPILCSTALVIVGAIVTYIFRYEALVIWLKLTHSTDFASFSYDVALSFNSEDEMLRKWVIKTLVPAIHNEGYKTFMPFVDVERGDDRTTGVIEAFKDSRNFVLILSTSYLTDGIAPENDIEEANELERKWIENEWKYAWHLFITDRRRKAIIVNYDHISASQVADKKIKAILRVGDMVNFGNHNDDMLQTIIQKIEKRVKRTGTDDFVELRVRPNANQVTPAIIKFRTNYVDEKYRY